MKELTKNAREEFSRLLNSTVIKGNASQEEYSALVAPIHNWILDNTPTSLYRYRSCNELNFDAFNQDVIWAVSPSKFNDPYDSLFFYDKEFIFQTVKQQMDFEHIKEIWKYVQQNKAMPPEFDRTYFSPKTYKEILSRYQQVTLKELKLAYSQNANTDQEIYDKLRIFSEKRRQEARKLNKIACFSEEITSPTMWAHYADYHKGFALEYNLQYGNGVPCDCCKTNQNCPNRKTANLFPVIYSEDRYNATDYIGHCIVQAFMSDADLDPSFPLHDSLFYQKMFTAKSTAWEYEKEWRLLCCCRDVHKTDTVEIMIRKPVAIYYGTQISAIHKKLLHSLAKEKEITEYQMILTDTNNGYGIIAEKITQ